MQRESQGNQLSRNGQQGQQSQSGQSGQQQSQSGQSGQQSGQQQAQGGQSGQQQQNGQPQAGQQQQNAQNRMQQQQNQMGPRGADPRQLQQLMDRLSQSINDMRDAQNQQAGAAASEANARRAADRLKEAQQMMQGMRNNQTAGQVDNLVQQADDLARKQQGFEGQMRRAFGQANQQGVTREQAEQMAKKKEAEIQDLKNLEKGMQTAIKDLQNTHRKAATKVRETLSEMQQAELARDMQRNADWIRRGIGQYGVMSEATVTQGLNEIRDQLKQVQQMLGQSGGKDDKQAQGDKQAEATLAQVERLRQQLEAMNGQRGGNQQGNQAGQRGNQQGNQQNGGQQNGGQQNGQQNGGQQNGGQQAGGQQSGGQQSGGQQSGGQQSGGQQAGGQQNGGNQPGGNPQGGGGNPQYGGGNNTYGPGGPRNGGYNGDPRGAPLGFGNYPQSQNPVRPEDFTQQYNQTLQALRQLEQATGQTDPNMIHDLQNLIRDMQRLNPNTFANDPLLNERIRGALMGGVQQVEMELRKKVEETNGTGSVRSPGGDKVPQGWEGSVAEYFRKLSKGK